MKVTYLGIGANLGDRYRKDFEIEYDSEQEFKEISRCIKEQLIKK